MTKFSDESEDVDNSFSEMEDENDLKLVLGDSTNIREYFYYFSWNQNKMIQNEFVLKNQHGKVLVYDLD